MNKEMELLPCPFCGVKHLLDEGDFAFGLASGRLDPRNEDNHSEWTISCLNDDCPVCPDAFGPTRAEAVMAWNARSSRELVWRPIETAPRDFTRVLVSNDRGIFAVEFDADWHNGFGWWLCVDGKDNEWPLRGGNPTHWMPLPEGPAA